MVVQSGRYFTTGARKYHHIGNSRHGNLGTGTVQCNSWSDRRRPFLCLIIISYDGSGEY